MKRYLADVSPNSMIQVCEDHFNLEEDLENYVKYRLQPTARPRLKKHVVPHIFACQDGRNIAKRPRSYTIDRNRKKLVQDILQSWENKSSSEGNRDEVTRPQDMEVLTEDVETTEVLLGPSRVAAALSTPECILEKFLPGTRDDEVTRTQNMEVLTKDMDAAEALLNLSSLAAAGPSSPERIMKSSSPVTTPVKKPIYVNTSCSPFKIEPIKTPRNPPLTRFKKLELSQVSDTDSQSISVSSDSFVVTSSSSLSDQFLQTVHLRSLFIKLVEKHPKKYLGIPDDCLFILGILENITGIIKINIIITLLKVKKNYSFEEIGDFLNFSISHVSKIFNLSVIPIAQCLRTLIIWPESNVIRRCLPIPFRANFYSVQSIIDCFEIEIEKPSNPIKQALTWSEYKKCNTMKYLISITPNGIINFISQGFGGRTSDFNVVKLSNYLNNLKPNSTVMADRGFKNVDVHLISRGCVLKRPPSVTAQEKLSKEQVIETKKIASLRIHVERLIRRIREFSFLAPHACVNHNLIKHLDSCVEIAAGLCNLQNALIK